MEPGSLAERFAAAALTLLVGAIAANIAIGILKSIWVSLVIILGIVGLVVGLLAWLRARHSRW